MGLIQRLNDTDPSKFYWGNQQPGTENLNNVNPRNIPFGNDRPGGGSSKQPYIISKPTNNTLNPSFYNDFILRGGALAPLSAVEDVARLTKYFTDIKNPSGLLFVAKQNILSKSGTKTEASTGLGYGLGTVNEGIYTPASTLGQALAGFTGTHLNKQGIDPTGLIPGLGIRTYQDAIYKNQLKENSTNNNRLVSITKAIIEKQSSSLPTQKSYKLNTSKGSTLISYSGGAGSLVGFGNTNIKFATDNTGENTLKSLLNLSNNTDPSNPTLNSTSLFSTWEASLFSEESLNPDGNTLNDFRERISQSKLTRSFLASTSGYTNDFEKRFGFDGGTGYSAGSKKRNRSNYYKGSLVNDQQVSDPLDTVTSYPIYKSELAEGSRYGTEKKLDDIIPFSIAILNNDNQNDPNAVIQTTFSYKKYMHFRAFIDSFSDSYDADWKSINYIGRAEKLYKYMGFDRKISMAFTVAAQSKDEINVMYDKLNFLASSLAPEYLDSLTSGYMTGNIAYITLGDYIVDQPGIITSLTFDVPEESPWEIENDGLGDKSTTRRLPHMIKVTGINFIPIQKFRPEKQDWNNEFSKSGQGIAGSKLLSGPGNQKFIDNSFIYDEAIQTTRKEELKNIRNLVNEDTISNVPDAPNVNAASFDKGIEVPFQPLANQNLLSP
jgi:hypothetical protein